MSCTRGCCETQVEHWRSVTFATDTPRRRADTRLGRDLDAYQRLRAQGLQPRGIDDCAALEQEAESRIEVEQAHIMPARMRKDWAEIENRGREAQEKLMEVGVIRRGDRPGVKNEWADAT